MAASALEQRSQEIWRATLNYLLASPYGYNSVALAHCKEDCQHHINHLAEAVRMGQPDLFISYIGWAQQLLVAYNVSMDDLKKQLEILAEIIKRGVQPDNLANLILEPVNHALQRLENLNETLASPELSSMARAYLDAVMAYDRDQAILLLVAARESGISVETLYLEVIQPVQYEIGRLWQTNQISVAHEHYATSIAQVALSHLNPVTTRRPPTSHTAVAACVVGEQHELGARMVADFLNSNGWNCFYFGPNTPTNALLAAIRHHKPRILALSISITPHLPQLVDVIKKARESGVPHMKIMVGGHPFNIAPTLWQNVGADLYARDASEALALANASLN